MLKKILPVLFLITSSILPQSDSTLILSEIMFYPQSGPNEFIELYNHSETESIDITGYKVKYSTSNPDLIIDAGEGTIIPPQSFAIILEGDYVLSGGIYEELIPTGALILKISDNAFGSSGMSNTENRQIWLINAANDTLEAYFYSANNTQAHSDEKKVMSKDSSQNNWANSLVANGTPGFANSITPVQFDLQMASLTFQPANPVEGDDVTVFAKVKNIGSSAADFYTIEIYNDANFDSTADPGEIIFTQQYTNLSAGDSITASTTMNSLAAGNYQMIAKVLFTPDENLLNNELISSFAVFPQGAAYNDAVINEIMYAPSTGEPEWIELYNRTGSPINLKKWKFSDAASTVTITSLDKIIPANDYLILSRDSSILNYYDVGSEIIVFSLPALNNTGDAVVIKDSLGIIIDSLSYLPSWGGNTGGKSLERISTEDSSVDPANWGTSTSLFKATPGFQNSVTPVQFDLQMATLTFQPTIPSEGDDVTILAKVRNLGTSSADNYTIEIYNDANFDSTADPGEIIFTQQYNNLPPDDSITASTIMNSLPSGNYQIISKVLFAPDEKPDNNELIKSFIVFPSGTNYNDVVINEIMYAPSTGEPEWVELYNRTTSPINLKKWKFSDAASTITITNIDKVIPANDYIVLSRDSSILNFYNVQSEIIVFNLPALNNTGDAVVIKDSLGSLIDSLSFLPGWGGSTGGRSLERISTEDSSVDPANWGTSTSLFKATSGFINSLTKKDFDIAVDDILFTPEFPIEGDTVSISTKMKNPGKNDANFSLQLFEDTNLDSIPDLLIVTLQNLFLASDDSAIFNLNFLIENIQTQHGFSVNAVFGSDQDSTNNKLYKTVEPGFPYGILLINEVMYNTEPGKPEWVELVNVSGEIINIKNWSISDVLTTPTKDFITNDDVMLETGEYIVIAKDTSFNSAHPGVTAKVFFANFGSLGNTSDGVVIYDFRNGIIDSLFYESAWGGGSGLSLERISLESETNESTNWTTSLDPSGSTPGEPNSILNVPDYERNDLVINEIMFDPGTDNSEFVEFLNLTSDTINVGGWEIVDENGNNFKLSAIPLLVPANSYFLLSADSLVISKYILDESVLKTIAGVSSLGLVNTGELILLKDVKGNVIDSVWYSDKWHNDNFGSTKNISLERINPNLGANDPNNWSSSVNSIGATPGKQNSIYTVNLNIESNISVSPNPFSPDNDGFEDFTIINYKLTQATSQVRIKIFDSKGRLVRTLENNQASGSSGSIIFDGIGDDGQTLRIGIYIIFLEAINEGSGVVETMKTVVVVARKL